MIFKKNDIWIWRFENNVLIQVVTTITGCLLPCQDQVYPQTGPCSLPLAPQTQWPYLFKQEKVRDGECLQTCCRPIQTLQMSNYFFLKSIMMQDKTLKGIVQHLGEAWSMPLWCLDARNWARASSQLTVPLINDVWCTALPGWFHCWEKDQGGRESAGDQWTSSDPDSSHW